jgi:cytochrome c554/c'-like protein
MKPGTVGQGHALPGSSASNFPVRSELRINSPLPGDGPAPLGIRPARLLPRIPRASRLLCAVAGMAALCAWGDTKAAPGSGDGKPAIESFSRDVRECVQCHAAESKSHPLTPMAHAAETNAECGVLKSHPLMKLRLGRYDYRIERQGDRSLYIVTDGAETVTFPIRYAFGLGEAGQTYILEKDGEYYESFVSYYQAIDGLDITIGDQPLKPSSLRDAAGRHIGNHEIATCFGCHTSNAVNGSHLSENTLLPGLTCEQCHGPTENHLAGLKKGDAQLSLMKKLTGMTAEESSQFCGQCHRTWEYVAEHGPHGVGNVRFQPYRLTNSKCFDVDDARISCTNCHNPHEPIDRVASHYDAKCQSCHGDGSRSAGKAGAKFCTVGSKNCSGCHMPKTELPGAHHSFTDHNIRIAVNNAPYPQ